MWVLDAAWCVPVTVSGKKGRYLLRWGEPSCGSVESVQTTSMLPGFGKPARNVGGRGVHRQPYLFAPTCGPHSCGVHLLSMYGPGMFPIPERETLGNGRCLEARVSSDLLSLARQRVQGDKRSLKLWPSRRAFERTLERRAFRVIRPPPIGCAFCGGGFFGFKFLGEGGYFEGLQESK